MKKKNIKIIVTIAIMGIIILALGGFIIYDKCFVKHENKKLYLPVYKGIYKNYDDSTWTGLDYFMDTLSDTVLEVNIDYTIECKYDYCYWYKYSMGPYDHITADVWIYYDNNAKDEGGYYLFNRETKEVLGGPYKDIKINENKIDPFIHEAFHGVYLYGKDGKTGYFAYGKINDFAFEPTYDSIEISDTYDFIITTKNGKKHIYYVNDYLEIIDFEHEFDSAEFTYGYCTEGTKCYSFINVKKDNKYSIVFTDYFQSAYQYFEIKTDFDYLYAFENYENDDENIIYYTYIKNGKTYLSKFTYRDAHNSDEAINNHEYNLTPGSYNILLSSEAVELYLESLEDNIATFVPISGGYGEYIYKVNLLNKKIITEKLIYDEIDDI